MDVKILSQDEMIAQFHDYLTLEFYPYILFNEILFEADGGKVRYLPLSDKLYCSKNGIKFIVEYFPSLQIVLTTVPFQIVLEVHLMSLN